MPAASDSYWPGVRRRAAVLGLVTFIAIGMEKYPRATMAAGMLALILTPHRDHDAST